MSNVSMYAFPALALGVTLGVILMITFRKAFSSFNHPLSRVQSMRNSLLAASSAERPPLPNEIRVIAAGDNAATLEVQSWEPLNPTRTSSSEPISNFFIMVPGNPGAVEPYAFFMEQMLGRAGGSNANTPWTFITLGHSAHSARTAQREGVSLQQQIEHKREVLSDLLRTHPNARLHFGGHSVGAHIVCELLRVLPPENVGKCVLLFPTLSNIGATPNGVRLTPAFNYLRGLLGWLVWGVNLLPSAARRRIVAQMSGATHDRSLDALLGSVLHPAVMQNAFFMAAHEMQEINGLDVEHFRAIEDKLFIYYGETDGWVRPVDANEIEATLTRARVVRCKDGHKHAFVLDRRSCEHLAGAAWDWVSAGAKAIPSAGKSLSAGAAGARASAAGVPAASGDTPRRRPRSRSRSGSKPR